MTPRRRGLQVGDVIELKEAVSFNGTMRQRFVVDAVRSAARQRIIFRAEDGTLCGLDPQYLVRARIIKVFIRTLGPRAVKHTGV
jgi:hypothetical protein